MESYRRALTLAPDLFEAWIGCGTVLVDIDRPEPALQCFTKSLELRPDDAVALLHLAAVLLALERAAEFLGAADAALRAGGDPARVLHIRAGALRRLGRRAEAARELETTVALDALDGGAWSDLSTVLHEMGRFEEAVVACRRALNVNPLDLQARTRLLARLVPSVPQSALQVDEARAEFEVELATFAAWLATRTLSPQDALKVARQQFFYLSYAGRSNRAVLQTYRDACSKRVEACFEAPRTHKTRTTGPSGGRFRLGFVSAHVHDHSVFNEADVYLDTIGFSGFNTLMQRWNAACPVSPTRDSSCVGGWGAASSNAWDSTNASRTVRGRIKKLRCGWRATLPTGIRFAPSWSATHTVSMAIEARYMP